MGQELPPDQMELYRRVDEVLHYLWDPCGVSDAPEARDEYYSYLPEVFSLLNGGASIQQIVDYLTDITMQRMGCSDTPSSREHTQKIAAILKRWREVIQARHSRTAYPRAPANGGWRRRLPGPSRLTSPASVAELGSSGDHKNPHSTMTPRDYFGIVVRTVG